MNITYVTGDILTRVSQDTPVSVIVCHQVNCVGVMGAGLAKQIKDKVPGVFGKYLSKCAQIKLGGDGLGDVQFCDCTQSHGFTVVNIFSQEGYGTDKCYTDYGAMRKALLMISKRAGKSTLVRIPYKMGCGLAGGNWDFVIEMIHEELVEKEVNVEIWRLPE